MIDRCSCWVVLDSLLTAVGSEFEDPMVAAPASYFGVETTQQEADDDDGARVARLNCLEVGAAMAVDPNVKDRLCGCSISVRS